MEAEEPAARRYPCLCGKGTVRPVRTRGRWFPYGRLAVQVPEGLAIPTCDVCGEEWLDAETAAALDAEFWAAVRAVVDWLPARQGAYKVLADLASKKEATT